MTQSCAVRGQLPKVQGFGSAPKRLAHQKGSVLVVWQARCFLFAFVGFLQDTSAPAKGRDAGRDNRKRAAPDAGVEQDDKQAKLAKIQCYKCKKFGHYATKCTS